MSLQQTDFLSQVKKQYRYKLKVNCPFFSTLIAAQILAVVFSYAYGVSTSSGSMEGISYTLKHISGNIILIFTCMWALVIGITFAGSSFRTDFCFVTNRLSSHLSSIALLAAAAVLAGTTATLGSVFLRDLVYFTQHHAGTAVGFWIAPRDMLTAVTAASLYAFLLLSAGYFFGITAQRNRIFIILIPGLLVGMLLVQLNQNSSVTFAQRFIDFICNETSLPLFTVKILAVSAVLYLLTMLISNRMEVEQ